MADEIPAGISYRKDLKAWWPEYDHDPVKCMQFVRHGLPAVDLVLKRCGKLRECVQAGGHAGFWPLTLAAHFEHVHTFEPERHLFDCMVRNCGAKNVTMYRHALGSAAGTAKMRSHVSAGSWRIDPDGLHPVTLLTVDALELKKCDAILLAIEGYEVEALRGALQTIERSRPVILCEMLPRSRFEIEYWMGEHAYQQVERFGRDAVFTYLGH